jgi:acetyltransferase-like isoleucine patch superfamily enzyme
MSSLDDQPLTGSGSTSAESTAGSAETSAAASGITGVAQRMLAATGRGYRIDPAIPAGYLIGEMVVRGSQLARGYVRLIPGVFVGRNVRIRGRKRMSIAKGVSIGDNSFIDARGTTGLVMGSGSRLGRFGVITTTSHLSRLGVGVRIGKNSGVGDFYQLGASGGLTIGENVIIGPGFYVHSQEHEYSDPTRPIRDQGTRQAAVTVGDDCWIGSKVTLLAGTTLGPRTIVAAGSVVRGEHPGGVILAGTPARIVKEI